jgi:hypothetical protein
MSRLFCASILFHRSNGITVNSFTVFSTTTLIFHPIDVITVGCPPTLENKLCLAVFDSHTPFKADGQTIYAILIIAISALLEALSGFNEIHKHYKTVLQLPFVKSTSEWR